ncbi:response regulator transcription factor [Vibrio sp. S4M6]|uniref:winged helix-turn-helix domain-containing protein n=1 Tax=Vibrio sinus TaxID=2946865 RepID=UPI00202A38BD|nr:response regulator transcription factor [Vibrio sinus]MCL9780652.1 response regulator transcription factor [Vibrio sinus]
MDRKKIKKMMIVNNDVSLIDELTEVLNARHNVNVARYTSGESALKALERYHFDYALISLTLPDTDGHQLCKEMRKVSCIPLIMTTDIDDMSEKLLAFHVGCDDYMVKPINVNELVARYKVIENRMYHFETKVKHRNDIFVFSDWELNTATYMLKSQLSQTEESISSADFKLLKAFIDHSGRVLSRDFLIECTKNRSRDVFDRSIDVRVSLLRKRLEINPSSPKIIKTVHNQGYMFLPKVEKM